MRKLDKIIISSLLAIIALQVCMYFILEDEISGKFYYNHDCIQEKQEDIRTLDYNQSRIINILEKSSFKSKNNSWYGFPNSNYSELERSKYWEDGVNRY